jgi:tetratricopeptide (TPR) repeat protein
MVDWLAASVPSGALSAESLASLPTGNWQSVRLAITELVDGPFLDYAEQALAAMPEVPGGAPWPGALRGRLAERRGDRRLAESVWRDVRKQQPDFPLAGAALVRLAAADGRPEEARALLDEMMARFPGAPDTLRAQADLAAAFRDWDSELAALSELVEVAGPGGDGAWLARRARALFRLWRVDEAWAACDEATGRFPDSNAGRAAKAAGASDLGAWSIALEAYSELVERAVRPEWIFGRARCLLGLGRAEEIPAVACMLDRQFPDSPFGRLTALRHARLMHLPSEVIGEWMEEACRRFPSERQFQAERIRLCLGDGQYDLAARLVADLESQGVDAVSLTFRWALVFDLEGGEALRSQVATALAGPDFGVESAPVAAFLLGQRSRWCVEAAALLLDRSMARHQNRIELVSARARCHVVLGEAEQAANLIESIPSACETGEVQRLRGWLAARRGASATARLCFERAARQLAPKALHGPDPRLERLTAGPTVSSDLVAFLTVRDEFVMAPQCLDHHRALGVEQFICIDNGSTDGTAEWLAKQPDVTLYRCLTSFAETVAGMRVVNLLRARHAAGRWSLYVDADERLIYPDCESVALPDLVATLEAEGADGMAAFMLDVYPERLFDAAGRPTSLSEFVWCDADYDWMEDTSPPYVSPVGGVRARLFGSHEQLQKIPLLRADGGRYVNPHETTAARMASVSGVLIHYKLFSMAQRYQARSADQPGNPFVHGDRAADFKRRSARYLRRIAAVRDADLRQPGVSARIGNSRALLELGLMRTQAAERAKMR